MLKTEVMEGKSLMKAEELVVPDYMLPPSLPGHQIAELSSCLRVPHVYLACMGVKNFNSEAPLIMYISKLVPTSDEDRVISAR